jgi:hypothetical protein
MLFSFLVFLLFVFGFYPAASGSGLGAKSDAVVLTASEANGQRFSVVNAYVRTPLQSLTLTRPGRLGRTIFSAIGHSFIGL